jgi:hypothetical protein
VLIEPLNLEGGHIRAQLKEAGVLELSWYGTPKARSGRGSALAASTLLCNLNRDSDSARCSRFATRPSRAGRSLGR